MASERELVGLLDAFATWLLQNVALSSGVQRDKGEELLGLYEQLRGEMQTWPS